MPTIIDPNELRIKYRRVAMTYAFTQDVPIDATFYRRIVEGLGDEPSEGFIAHLAVERPEGGLRYIDVWESEEDWDRFAEERLHPVVHGLLREIFGDQLPPEPERTSMAVVDVWIPGTARR
jgi:heme-degrading monooxygenase HmoA